MNRCIRNTKNLKIWYRSQRPITMTLTNQNPAQLTQHFHVFSTLLPRINHSLFHCTVLFPFCVRIDSNQWGKIYQSLIPAIFGETGNKHQFYGRCSGMSVTYSLWVSSKGRVPTVFIGHRARVEQTGVPDTMVRICRGGPVQGARF